ncbi:MAG: hypothetical protein A2Y10_19575 [Planctomycetes bacterium GWF2_41_51]|nr:MAG: hypothetical protein A2Y10_19575 [Planctomycetes bacterium GWF2_41_51]HBG28181.1 hypothetical protein [Phycisphaerales bacterium]
MRKNNISTDKMSLITFILINSLKGLRDSDENAESAKKPQTDLLKKIACRTSKFILRSARINNLQRNSRI